MNEEKTKSLEYINYPVVYRGKTYPVKYIKALNVVEEPLQPPQLSFLAIATLNDIVAKLEKRILELEKQK